MRCLDCYEAGESGSAAFIRSYAFEKRPLCFRHKALWAEREELGE